MAGRPALYAELIADPLYLSTLVNTALFGVNVKMFLALLLSGFFLRRRPLKITSVTFYFSMRPALSSQQRSCGAGSATTTTTAAR
jgi:hypothetical protein